MIVDSSKCFRIVSIGFLYIFLSVGLAFICHRLYFSQYEGADWPHYLFGSVIFAVSLFGLYTWLQFRIFVFLLVPKLFNVNGRTVLLIYMTYLTLWGPLLNTKRNIQVMSTTLVCSFEEIRAGASELIEIMKEPVVYLMNLIATMEETTKKIFAQLARELKEVQKFAEDMIQHFKTAIRFLQRLTSVCEDKLISPMEYCLQTVRKTIRECEEEHETTICSPLLALYPMCTPLAALEIFCLKLDFDFLDIHFIEFLEQGFHALLEELGKMVDAEVAIDGDYEVKTNKTQTYEGVRTKVANQFKDRTGNIFIFVEISKVISMVFSFYLFITIYRFKYKYRTDVHFQNRYLLRSLKEINEVRVARGEASVFPLNHRERQHFIVIYSWRVTYWEVIQAIHGIAEVITPCFYVVCIIFGDYALYYLLRVINEGSRTKSVDTPSSSTTSQPPVLTVDIEGEGFVADFMQSIVATFLPVINGLKIDFGVCAPKPHKPDGKRTLWLLFMCFTCLVQAALYPYAARAQHLIMELYYPDETRLRMAWLYNDILRRRKTLSMLIAQKVGGNFTDGHEDPIPVMDWLRAQWGDHWLCRWLLQDEKGDFCLNCARSLVGMKANVGFFKCPTYGCSGIYCKDCLPQLKWVCIICKATVNRSVSYDLQLVEVDESKF